MRSSDYTYEYSGELDLTEMIVLDKKTYCVIYQIISQMGNNNDLDTTPIATRDFQVLKSILKLESMNPNNSGIVKNKSESGENEETLLSEVLTSKAKSDKYNSDIIVDNDEYEHQYKRLNILKYDEINPNELTLTENNLDNNQVKNPFIINTKDNSQIILNSDSFKEEQSKLFDELTERITKRLADNYNKMMDKVFEDKYKEAFADFEQFEKDHPKEHLDEWLKNRRSKANSFIAEKYHKNLETELFKNVKNNDLEQTKFYIISESHILESALYHSWTHYYYLKLNSNNKIFRLTFQITPRYKVDCKILVDIREGNSYNRLFTEQYIDFYTDIDCNLFENISNKNNLKLIEIIDRLEFV